MAVHGAGLETIDWVPTILWTVFGLFVVVRTFGGHRLLELSVDRGTGHVEWRRSHVFGLGWSESIPFESLGGFALALASKPGSLTAKLKLALRRRAESREERFELGLSGLRDSERIAAFGLRLAAAAGVPYYRVTLNESGRFAMEASASAQPGSSGSSRRRERRSMVAAGSAPPRRPPWRRSGCLRSTQWRFGETPGSRSGSRDARCASRRAGASRCC